MGEVRRALDMSSYEMDSGYPDSVNSSPHSRETDHSDHRWEAADSASTGSQFRLMCSYGGKIQQRPHDNHLSYVGGDTRILAVERSIGFASMNAKLSSLCGGGVSLKYQLPNEDLDALVSVTNDEDMENMMAEYERLQKMGYRFSRLRLFVFANKPAPGTSSQMEETKQESWFVDALNTGPVRRSEAPGPPGGQWMNNNMPNYLSGPEGGNGVEADQTNSKTRDVHIGRELQHPEVQSDSSSPIIGYSSDNSMIASAPARKITSATHQGFDYGGRNQAEMGLNLGHGFEHDRNHHTNYSRPADSSPVQEIGVLKSSDRTQEQYPSEILVVSGSVINERAHHEQPQLQVPIQELQKLQLRQPHDPIGAWQVEDNGNLNIAGRRMYSEPVRAVNLSKQDISTRPHPVDQGSYMLRQQQIQQHPSPSEYYVHDQGSGHFASQSYWQMQEPHGDQQYHPVYFMPARSPVTAVTSMGQPVPEGGEYYGNPVQRVTAPVHFYSPEVAPLSNPVTTVRAATAVQRAHTGSDHPTEPYRTPIQIPAPVPKGQYTSVPASGPVASDAEFMYKATAPVPLVHTEQYSYQNMAYEPSSRQVYYTQATPAMNPQYQLMNPEM